MTTLAQRFTTWRYVMNHANMPEGVQMDSVSKWLIVTRAAVFTMTATSGIIGGLLAIGTAGAAVNYWYLSLSVIGLVIAHAANNMINDYFDLEGGVDTDEYVRALYAPHPILSGWLTKAQLRNAILLMQAFDLAILLVLVWARGPWVAAFAFGGLFISVFYVAPPIKLKHHGLGEPGVFIVWGPLMIAGTYFVATGTLPGWVWVDSLPYAILVTTVLFGKHIDKISADTAKGIHTLPVILGERRSRWVAQGLMIAFYPIVIGSALDRLDRSVRDARRPRHPAAAPGAQAVLGAATRDAAAELRRLAALVRGRGLHPHSSRRRAADRRTAPQRDPAGTSPALDLDGDLGDPGRYHARACPLV